MVLGITSVEEARVQSCSAQGHDPILKGEIYVLFLERGRVGLAVRKPANLHVGQVALKLAQGVAICVNSFVYVRAECDIHVLSLVVDIIGRGKFIDDSVGRVFIVREEGALIEGCLLDERLRDLGPRNTLKLDGLVFGESILHDGAEVGSVTICDHHERTEDHDIDRDLIKPVEVIFESMDIQLSLILFLNVQYQVQ